MKRTRIAVIILLGVSEMMLCIHYFSAYIKIWIHLLVFVPDGSLLARELNHCMSVVLITIFSAFIDTEPLHTLLYTIVGTIVHQTLWEI